MEISHVNLGLILGQLSRFDVRRMHLEFCTVENHFLIVCKIIDPLLSSCLYFLFRLFDNLLGCIWLLLLLSSGSWLVFEDSLRRSCCNCFNWRRDSRLLVGDSFCGANNLYDCLEGNCLICWVTVVQVIEETGQAPLVYLIRQAGEALQELFLHNSIFPPWQHLL